MKALVVTGTTDEKGQLILDRPLTLDTPDPVRIIRVLPEPKDEAEDDPDDTLVAEITASVRKAWPPGQAGQTLLILEVWERIDFRF
ncbi:type II toxin-antitoxin system RelN family antitoxin [Microcoleus sp. S13C4]|uniref:type II toxin-antitoxin system RelN family antitoxin n=1 Tax=Microcoleus sp. S13C4 TaxID=3055410 RepID=UPI002FCEFC5C